MGIGLQGSYVRFFSIVSFLGDAMSRGWDTWPITCVEDS
jgi:hypothetical protein